MSALQKAHWYFLDHLAIEYHIQPIGEYPFFYSALYQLAKRGIDPFYDPKFYFDEWSFWSQKCMVGGVALVRETPDHQWEVLMVKCYKKHLAELSTTWPGGKADPTDSCLWDVVVREVLEEVGLDLSQDRSKVVDVVQNRRVFNAVIPIDYQDARLKNMKMKENEIFEMVWAPLSTDINKIRTPKRLEGPIVDNGKTQNKINPPEMRMPADFQQSFRMLQNMHAMGRFTNPNPNAQSILDQDPKNFLKKPY